MDRNITIQVNNTANDYRRALVRVSAKWIFLVGIIYLIVILPMLWMVLYGAGGSTRDANSSVGQTFALLTLIPIGIAAALYLNIWRQSKIIERSLEKSIFVFSDDGVESTSRLASVKVAWETLQKIRELKDYFLFYPQKNVFYIIPKRFFVDENQLLDFRNLVKEKFGDKAKLKD